MKKQAESTKNPLRNFMSTEFRNTRKSLGFTQARMAEELGIDVRSYSYLEKGENLCSTPVLIRYIAKFKQQDGGKVTAPDAEFVQEAYRILSSADSRLV